MWLFEDSPLQNAPEGAFGFVYEIVCVTTGRKYIGKKQFWMKHTRPALKGKKRKRRTMKESDWRSYWGSCLELQEDVLKYGEECFRRNVLKVCMTKSDLTYSEIEAQVKRDVLTAKLADGRHEYYNGNIMNRFFRRGGRERL
jgi:hypothetical protein